jgi:antitoxin CcdA
MKRATNLSVDADLLREAKDLGINLSQTLEDALRVSTKAERERRWLEENAEAIKSYNDYIREHGLWCDGLRSFDEE